MSHTHTVEARLMAIWLVEVGGHTMTFAAAVVGAHRQSVSRWLKDPRRPEWIEEGAHAGFVYPPLVASVEQQMASRDSSDDSSRNPLSGEILFLHAVLLAAAMFIVLVHLRRGAP